ncbi:Kinase, CMGC CDK [Giardia muris]|uniref:Kinase, CMGC CDK n=1 Tax=Giardia muris TaxID=5742 RepID=A0A4Z1SWT2_GIAMU|nr:Kinase, CMGC CDK [Giardia muris]|eukprot:TNJ29305.1 Kinase, CMGC CDK [Giardia muris]
MEAYELDKTASGFLGAGTYGVILKGVRKADGVEVALKFVGLSEAFDVLSFRESLILSFLATTTRDGPVRNPAVELLDFFRIPSESIPEKLSMKASSKAPFSAALVLVMPLYAHDCERVRMRNLMSDFSFTQFITYWRSLITSLHTLHRLGVVHRDIKPSNILLGRDGFARFADLGMARFCPLVATLETLHAGVSFEGARYGPAASKARGTLLYRPPEGVFCCEQFLRLHQDFYERIDEAECPTSPLSLDGLADAYALGLVLLESVVSRVIFYLPLLPNASGLYRHYMCLLMLRTYRRDIKTMFDTFATACGLRLRPAISEDEYLQALKAFLVETLLPIVSDDEAVRLVDEALAGASPNLSETVLTCLAIRFGRTSHEAALKEFASLIGKALSTNVLERCTSAQLARARLLKADSSNAMHVLGGTSTLGASGDPAFKRTYELDCSCFGDSKFLVNLGRLFQQPTLGELTRVVRLQTNAPCSLLAAMEHVKVPTTASATSSATTVGPCRSVKR